MPSSTALNLEAIVRAIEQHDSNCESKAKAILLSPYEHDRLGFDSIPVKGRSVPVRPDDSLGTGRFRIVCDGYHGPKREETVEETVEAPAPAERELVPAGAPSTPWSEPSSDPQEDLSRWHQKAWDEVGTIQDSWQCIHCGGSTVLHRPGCPFA